MVWSAAVILEVGKVELRAVVESPPPPYLAVFKPKKPMYIGYEPENFSFPTPTLEIDRIRLLRHRMVGFSTLIAYWPESWQDSWAIEELLKWEGREDEIRRDQYYADFIVDENQQARENERRQLESKSVRSGSRPMVFVVHESVPESRVDPGPDVLGRSKSDGHLRLERGVSGGHEADLSGEDEER